MLPNWRIIVVATGVKVLEDSVIQLPCTLYLTARAKLIVVVVGFVVSPEVNKVLCRIALDQVEV